ncbi:MAG: branched-chain amino acid ABC transporter permease, partial [Gemmatimonadales bacterium]
MSGNDMIDSGRSVLRVLLLLTALAPSEAAAQQSDSAGQEPGQEPAAQEPAAREPTAGRLDAERPDRDQPFGPVDSASVQFDGNVLFAVRGIPGFPAHERARDIADRLKTIARNRTVDLSSLRTEEAELGTQILAGETPVVLVTDLDAQLVGVPDRSALADLYLTHIREVVDEYRADRETGALLFRALYAIGATLALALALLALRWLFRKSLAIDRLYGVKVGDLSVKSAQLVRADQIRRLIQSSLRAGFGFATLILIYVYLNGVLGLFPWTRGIARDLLRYVLDPLQTILLGFIGYLPNLLFILILAIVTRLLLKGLKIFLASVAAGRVHLSGFDPDWAWPTYRLVIITSGLLVALILYVMVSRTRLGMLIRAGASNRTMVEALGININKLFLIVFAIGATMSGFAGMLIAPITEASIGMGNEIIIIAFVVVIVGGIGSIRGAFFAALIIGLMDTLGRSYLDDVLELSMPTEYAETAAPALSAMLVYILMAVVLAFQRLKSGAVGSGAMGATGSAVGVAVMPGVIVAAAVGVA